MNRLCIPIMLGLAMFWLSDASMGSAQEKRRTGTLSGVVIDKGNSKDGRNGWVEVKADGEEKGRRYWPVGDPKVGGPDREILAAIRKVDAGSRVRMEWVDAGDGNDITKFEVLSLKKKE